MKILLGFAGLLLSACAHLNAPSVALRNVTIVDVIDGSLRAEQTVLIAGNRIAAIGRAEEIDVPDDADVLDAAGGFLIPGLWDMHVHSVANVRSALSSLMVDSIAGPTSTDCWPRSKR